MLHDRDELFALVEQSVGLELHENRRPRNSQKGTPPIVVAQGRRGSGKTAALNEIFAAYRNRVPEALLDLAAQRYATADGEGYDPGLPLLRWREGRPDGRPGIGRPSWDTPLLRLLRDAKWELELHIPDNGRLRFPRLDIAQLAVATWQREWKPKTEITVAQARHQLNRAREAVEVKDRPEHEIAVEWIADVLSEFSGTTVGFPADVFVKATVSAFLQSTLPGLGKTLTVLGKTLTRRGPDVPVKWHEQFDPREPGDGYDVLITLARDWSEPGHRRRHEQRLVSAFLADLSAEYTGLAGMNRAVPPVVLLDNADASPAGERFLTLAHADRVRAKGDADPLVLVAAAPETFRLADPADGRGAGKPPRGVPLTPLADDTVDRELDHADPLEFSPDFPLLVHRLTGGLPQGVRVLTKAVTSAVPGHPHPAGRSGAGPLRAAGLLDVPAAAGDGEGEGAPGDGVHNGGARGGGARAKRGGRTTRPSVVSLLLRRLIPDDTWRSRLTLLSCARDDVEARALLAPLIAADRVRFVVSDAEELLEDNDWLDPRPPAGRERCRCGPPGSGFFVGDAFVRTLLRHQLAVTGEPVPAAHAHATLRDLYGGAGTGMLASTEPPRLYHCLALGDAEYVAQRLHAAFAGSDARNWLAALVHAAAAPRPGPAVQAGEDGDDPRREVALGGGDASAADTDPAYQSVNRLLHAAWYLHDPLVSPEGAADEVIDALADALRSLARAHPRGYGVLFHASRGWPRRLRAWDQSYCPTSEGE